jgi:hypothetical protein
MSIIDQKLKEGYSIEGATTWLSVPSKAADGAVRHLQMLYVQKGTDLRCVLEDIDSAGAIRWFERNV